jgi:hypothetical protein
MGGACRLVAAALRQNTSQDGQLLGILRLNPSASPRVFSQCQANIKNCGEKTG